eukprot:TRINITY_DN26346_c0_g1_i1.p1 TRINITY_DN26346_c0_g1~~TRINITY_DN26346_c0_g1_i1.p1  ORF type:complete len:606 (-),score=43.28 TRINITY_DN26346_c0_g1_i1:331-1908(-)
MLYSCVNKTRRVQLSRASNSGPQHSTLEKEHIDISQEDSAYDILQHQLKDVLQGHSEASQEVLELNSKLSELEESLELLALKEQDFQKALETQNCVQQAPAHNFFFPGKATSSNQQEEGSLDRSRVVRKVRVLRKDSTKLSRQVEGQNDAISPQGDQVVFKSKKKRRSGSKGIVSQVIAPNDLAIVKKGRSMRKGTATNMHQKLQSTKLLKSEDEKELNLLVKRLVEFENIKQDYVKRHNREPSEIEWASLCGFSYGEFVEELSTCRDAKQRFVEANMRLVMSVARKYVSSDFTLHELVQDGIQGLIRAVEKFDSNKGFRFSTYAHWWIRQFINRGMWEHGRVVRLPTYYYEQLSKINKVTSKFEVENDRTPTEEELSKLSGFAVERIRKIRDAMQNPASLQAQVAGKQDGASMEEVIEDEGEYQDPEHRIFQQMMHKDIEAALNNLNPKERMILKLRYGIDGGRPHTLEEIGNLLNLTRERVRQIESIAKINLRDPNQNGTLQEYVSEGVASKQRSARKGVRRD